MLMKQKSINQLFYCFSAVAIISLSSCGGSSDVKTEATTESAAPAAEKITIDGTGWAPVDLSTIAPMIHVTMNVPTDAKMEKNGNGGVDIMLNKAYTITVSMNASSSVADAITSDKSLSVTNTTSYMNGKAIVDEPNGFVYSMQMKDEANGNKYEPEAHFAFYLEKDGAIYSIMDARPMDNMFLAGSTYSEENAKKLYDLVKGSATIK